MKMHTAWQKGCALAAALAMVFTALAVMSAPGVRADTTVANTNDRFRVTFVDAYMLSETVYDEDPVSGDHYLLGSGDGVRDWTSTANTLRINLTLVNTWPMVTTCALNITAYDAAVFDFDDPDHAANSEVNGGTWTAGIPAVNTTGWNAWDFSFDVLKTSGLGSASNTELTVKLWYSGGGSGTGGNNVNFNARIYLSSIFDDEATDGHALADPVLDDVSPGEDDPFFEAGDTFQDTDLALHNYDGTAIDNIYATVDPVDDDIITLAGDKDTCWIPGTIAGGANQVAKYRTDVASGAPPGMYPGSLTINYTRADSHLRVTESGLVINWPVNFNFRNTDPMPVDEYYSYEQVTATEVVVEGGGAANNTTKVSDTPLEDSENGTAEGGAGDMAEGDGATAAKASWNVLVVAGAVAVLVVLTLAVLYIRRSKN
jgi:hypothetical protein